MTTLYVVTSNGQPDSIFTDEAKAQSYATKENNLDKARHPHQQTSWIVHPLELDAKA